MSYALTAAVATPLSDAAAELIRRSAPEMLLLHEPELLPPMRFAADFEGDPSFRRSAAQDARYHELLETADALFGVPGLDPAALKRVADVNDSLRWVHTTAAGGGAQVRAARLTDAQLHRVAFTTSAGVHGDMLAEFALFGVFSGAKHLGRLRTLQAERTWPDRWEMQRVSDQRILVLGLGGIGTEVVQRLAAVGAEVRGCARHPRPIPGLSSFIAPADLPVVIGDFDAIVCTLPGTPATEGLLDHSLLERLKPGATIVNVGRGTVIDEPALIEALNTGRVGFAALDVVAAEPLDQSSPLWSMPNVVISPHTAALHTSEEMRIAALFADNAVRLIEGRPLRNLVDTVEFY